MNQELPDVQAGFKKGKGTRHQIANIRWIIEKARGFQKNIYFCFIDYAKAFVWITANWKILKEMGIPAYLSPEKPVCRSKCSIRIKRGKTDWFKTGEGVQGACISSPCLLNLYAEYIIQNAKPDEAKAGMKTARRNINNLRYADATTLMTESREVKSLLMKVKESEKSWLKTQHSEN